MKALDWKIEWNEGLLGKHLVHHSENLAKMRGNHALPAVRSPDWLSPSTLQMVYEVVVVIVHPSFPRWRCSAVNLERFSSLFIHLEW